MSKRIHLCTRCIEKIRRNGGEVFIGELYNFADDEIPCDQCGRTDDEIYTCIKEETA